MNTYILPGIAKDEWRILVGPDALEIDKAVREDPFNMYDAGFTGLGIGEGLCCLDRAKEFASLLRDPLEGSRHGRRQGRLGWCRYMRVASVTHE